jgi:hypothetical protein
MSTKHLAGMLALACALTVSFAADKNQIRVESSRALRLAVVDSERKAPGHDALQSTFTEALAFELSQRCKSPVPVKPSTPAPDQASWGLSNGSFDVALVIGTNLPRALMSADFEVVKAAQSAGKGKFALFFIVRKDDPGLAEMLTAAFPEALKGQFFLRAVAKANGQEVPDDWKVVVAAN